MTDNTNDTPIADTAAALRTIADALREVGFDDADIRPERAATMIRLMGRELRERAAARRVAVAERGSAAAAEAARDEAKAAKAAAEDAKAAAEAAKAAAEDAAKAAAWAELKADATSWAATKAEARAALATIAAKDVD